MCNAGQAAAALVVKRNGANDVSAKPISLVSRGLHCSGTETLTCKDKLKEHMHDHMDGWKQTSVHA
jgi:hypothetical protein